MPNKKKKKLKRRKSIDSFVKKTIDEIKKGANFQDYKITFGFSKKELRNDDGALLAASIHVDTTYRQAHITLMPYLVSAYRKGELDEVRSVLCHEMAHNRTQKLYNYAVDRYIPEKELRSEWESLTEELGRTIYDKVYKK